MIREHDAGYGSTILLKDMHQEYTGDFGGSGNAKVPEGMKKMDGYYRCFVIWDFHEIENASTLEVDEGLKNMEKYETKMSKVTEAFYTLFPNLPATLDEIGDGYGAIWKVYAKEPGHRNRFTALYKALNRTPSGDDDVYDYWPNTYAMLAQYAVDLDTEYREGRAMYSELAMRLYEKIHKATWREDDEYDEWGSPDDNRRWITKALKEGKITYKGQSTSNLEGEEK